MKKFIAVIYVYKIYINITIYGLHEFGGENKVRGFLASRETDEGVGEKTGVGGSFGTVTGSQPHEEVGNVKWQALPTQW